MKAMKVKVKAEMLWDEESPYTSKACYRLIAEDGSKRALIVSSAPTEEGPTDHEHFVIENFEPLFDTTGLLTHAEVLQRLLKDSPWLPSALPTKAYEHGSPAILEEHYRDSVIKEWNVKALKKTALLNAEPDPDTEGGIIALAYMGSVMGIFPSGKYYMPWTTNQTPEDEILDEAYAEQLENLLNLEGLTLQGGEGDPTDLFAACYFDDWNEYAQACREARIEPVLPPPLSRYDESQHDES